MGLDQGNELQIVIAKLEPLSRRPKIVRIELIPFEDENEPNKAGFGRVKTLMNLFKIRRMVADADPNRHSVRALQNKMPGRVLMADYTSVKKRYQTVKEKNIISHVNINRSEAFDDLMDSIREGFWALPGLPPILPPMVDTLISHVTALKRDIEERRTPSGIRKTVVWRKLRPDHLAHCMLYLKLALEIDTGTHHKIVVIGKSPKEEESSEVDNLTYWPKPDIIAGIVPFFGQVSQEQAQLYFQLQLQEKLDPKTLPMPLRHSYNRAVGEKYQLQDIEWVLSRIASFGNAPIPKSPTEEKQVKVVDEPKFRMG
jgi:hypothetical protein